jgi:hypothetical protein
LIDHAALWAMVESGPIRLAPLDDDDVPRVRELMAKYRDLPMDLADAAPVHVAERDGLRQRPASAPAANRSWGRRQRLSDRRPWRRDHHSAFRRRTTRRGPCSFSKALTTSPMETIPI